IASTRRRQLRKRSTEELRRLAELGGQKHPGRREAIAAQYVRSEAVSALVKRLANGHCDLCGDPAPFHTDDGPYLECHHVEQLAKGGADTITNAVALCPNCHRRMHSLNLS